MAGRKGASYHEGLLESVETSNLGSQDDSPRLGPPLLFSCAAGLGSLLFGFSMGFTSPCLKPIVEEYRSVRVLMRHGVPRGMVFRCDMAARGVAEWGGPAARTLCPGTPCTNVPHTYARTTAHASARMRGRRHIAALCWNALYSPASVWAACRTARRACSRRL